MENLITKEAPNGFWYSKKTIDNNYFVCSGIDDFNPKYISLNGEIIRSCDNSEVYFVDSWKQSWELIPEFELYGKVVQISLSDCIKRKYCLEGVKEFLFDENTKILDNHQAVSAIKKVIANISNRKELCYIEGFLSPDILNKKITVGSYSKHSGFEKYLYK